MQVEESPVQARTAGAHSVRGGMVRPLVQVMRPHQWTKNLLCLAGVIFGDRFTEAECWWKAGGTFLAFSLVSSAVYIWNDLHDRDRDRFHPEKCRRPIASGELPVSRAAVLGILLVLCGVATGAFLGEAMLACLLLYLLTNALYSVWLKHLALFDVLCITLGFVLRILGGIYVLGDLPTAWIILCSFFLAAFLGFAKRRAELSSIGREHEEDAARLQQRPALRGYTLDYLDFLISSSATMTTMSYAMFATTSGKSPSLIVTLPIVFYAIMYYKRLVMIGQIGQEPERILLKDGHILLCIVIWLALFMLIWLGQVHIIR